MYMKSGEGDAHKFIIAYSLIYTLPLAARIPFDWRDEGTLVIPGHGRLLDQLDVVEYRDMVVIIRDRIRAMVKQGKTLEQVKAASPAQGYKSRYGADSGPWTTNMFIEAIYRSLTQEQR